MTEAEYTSDLPTFENQNASWPSSTPPRSNTCVAMSTRIWDPDENSCKGPTDQWPCIPLHIHGPRQFHRTWDNCANRSSGCRVTASTKTWVPNRNAQPRWANDHAVAHTVETLYNTVNFCWSTHKRHSIARPKGRGMGCLLWVQRATYCVDLSKLSSIKYLL